jgi:hypothetical protein
MILIVVTSDVVSQVEFPPSDANARSLIQAILPKFNKTTEMLAHCSRLLNEEKDLSRSFQSLKPEDSIMNRNLHRMDSKLSRRSDRPSQRADKDCRASMTERTAS